MGRGRRRPPDAYQSSASDQASIDRADRLVKERLRQEAQAMADTLKTPGGRRMLWMVLEHCHMLEDIWDPSVRMHYLAGQQEVGHFIVGKIVAVDEMGYLKMQQEALMRGKRDAATVEAMDTDRVLTEDDDAAQEGT